MLRIAIILLASSIALSAHAQQVQSPTATPDKSAVKKSAPPKGQKATTDARPASPPASRRCVGVMSDVEGFGVTHVGLTIFNNESKEISIKGWGLDELVLERVRAAVGPGVAVTRVNHAKGALGSYKAGNTLFANNDAAAAELVRKIVGPARCERYIVVTKLTAQSGSQDIAGVGILNKGIAALSVTSVHAMLRTTVHDGGTFAPAKSRAGVADRNLRPFKWPESPEAVDTPEVRAAARATVVEALDKALPAVLAP